jgi:hypothetical protein
MLPSGGARLENISDVDPSKFYMILCFFFQTLHNIEPQQWTGHSIKSWRRMMSGSPSTIPKALSSLTLLIVCAGAKRLGEMPGVRFCTKFYLYI